MYNKNLPNSTPGPFICSMNIYWAPIMVLALRKGQGTQQGTKSLWPHDIYVLVTRRQRISHKQVKNEGTARKKRTSMYHFVYSGHGKAHWEGDIWANSGRKWLNEPHRFWGEEWTRHKEKERHWQVRMLGVCEEQQRGQCDWSGVSMGQRCWWWSQKDLRGPDYLMPWRSLLGFWY